MKLSVFCILYFQLTKMQRREKQYTCSHCQRQGRNYSEAKYRVIGHVLKHHFPLDQYPFYSTLCLYSASTKDQLLKHVSQYKRYCKLAQELNVIDNSRSSIENSGVIPPTEPKDFHQIEYYMPEDPLQSVMEPPFTATLVSIKTPV